jgi:hypothetical protein
VIRTLCLAAAMLIAGPAAAQGFGPLKKSGITDADKKGFYFTLLNPYPGREEFLVYAVGAETEHPADRVVSPKAPIALAPRAERKVLIVAKDLQPGETYHFRVCAERVVPLQENVHARVCSRVIARRILPRG